MPMYFERNGLLMILSVTVLLIASIGFAGVGASQATQCQPNEDRQLCITEFTVSDDEIVTDEEGEFSIQVSNQGNTTATGTLQLHTASPENETDVYRFNQITLDPGEQQTVTRKINASTPGTHGMRVTLSETNSQHVFDISEIKTIAVLEEHPNELGGPIDRTEIALGALVAAVLGMLAMGYRQLNS